MIPLPKLLVLSLLLCFVLQAKNAVSDGNAQRPSRYWAQPCQFPPIALLKISTRSRSHFCGGTLVDNKNIITAAHCFPNGTTSVEVILGATNSNTISNRNPNVTSFKIPKSAVHLHKAFKVLHKSDLLYENDAAYVTLPRPLNNYTKCIRPISMATDTTRLYARCYLVGWDISSRTGRQQARLTYQIVNLVQKKSCDALSGKVKDRRICAHSGSKQCYGGDAGSLICFTPNKRPVAAGFTSSPAVCHNGVSICNKVSYFFTAY
ncbi:coagulation factor IX-like [Argonauta hians]